MTETLKETFERLVLERRPYREIDIVLDIYNDMKEEN